MMKWTIPIVCVVGALVIALGANIGVWYGKSKQAVVVEPVEISEPIPETVVKKEPNEFPDEPVLPAGMSLTADEILDLPYDDRPLGASWYKVYTDILDDPTGFKKGLDYTPVVPFIVAAMKKGYLINRDYRVIQNEINKVGIVAEIDRARELIKKVRDKLISELKERQSR